MPYISQVRVGNNTYDIKDAEARRLLFDLQSDVEYGNLEMAEINQSTIAESFTDGTKCITVFNGNSIISEYKDSEDVTVKTVTTTINDNSVVVSYS